MSTNLQTATNVQEALPRSQSVDGLLQRKCDCGQHTNGGPCTSCSKKGELNLQRSSVNQASFGSSDRVPPIVSEVLQSSGQPLDSSARTFMETRFAHDFSHVRIHSDARAGESARAVNALAYTVGRDVVFRSGQYAPYSGEGRKLIAHELAHVVQQGSSTFAGGSLDNGSNYSMYERNADLVADAALSGGTVPPVVGASPTLHRRAAPYIKLVTVHLTPDQSADLAWEGTPPADATGSDHFTVSTGKGYGDPGDPPRTCTRNCCSDAATQCVGKWTKAGTVGSCCTYSGDGFWTGVPEEEHNTWKWWTPIQPNYSSRGIALHQHPEVTGKPIGHGCVRMDEPNAKRIFDFSNRGKTLVKIDGTATPVACAADRQCASTGSTGAKPTGTLEETNENRMAMESQEEATPGQEGMMS